LSASTPPPQLGGAKCCGHGVEPLATNVEEPDLPHMWLDLMKAATGGQESMFKVCEGMGERGARREGRRERGCLNRRLAPPLATAAAHHLGAMAAAGDGWCRRWLGVFGTTTIGSQLRYNAK
jgi:hypothetical protein